MRKRSKGAGSSPLTRGKRSVTVPVNITARLIPAHAGKTYCQDCRALILPAHPRSRGENKLGRVSVSVQSGSSPLTRGKLECPGLIDHDKGLIPAHAGKTRCPFRARKRRAAHPRSRGENSPSRARWLMSVGSSPLTRGKQSFADGFDGSSGLIPAHAGKTLDGELSRIDCRGSSPLTRGKLPRGRLRRSGWRLIPAHAGKTRDPRAHPALPPAHPRSRGENRCVAHD